jgi:hypothetical protein
MIAPQTPLDYESLMDFAFAEDQRGDEAYAAGEAEVAKACWQSVKAACAAARVAAGREE